MIVKTYQYTTHVKVYDKRPSWRRSVEWLILTDILHFSLNYPQIDPFFQNTKYWLIKLITVVSMKVKFSFHSMVIYKLFKNYHKMV